MVEIAGSLVPIGVGIAGAAGGASSFSMDYELVFAIIGHAAGFPSIRNVPEIEVALVASSSPARQTKSLRQLRSSDCPFFRYGGCRP
jgi:hypothetical protein